MFAVSGLGITLFLGGWHAPLPCLAWIPSWVWFFAKLLALHLPVHLGARHAAAAAHGPAHELCLEIHAADGAGQHARRRACGISCRPGLARWIVCAVLVARRRMLLLGRGLAGRNRQTSYRYATESTTVSVNRYGIEHRIAP